MLLTQSLTNALLGCQALEEIFSRFIMPNCRKYNVDNDEFRRKKLYNQVRSHLLCTLTITVVIAIDNACDVPTQMIFL